MSGFLRPRVTGGFTPVAAHDERPSPYRPAPDYCYPPGEDRGACEARRAREWAELAALIEANRNRQLSTRLLDAITPHVYASLPARRIVRRQPDSRKNPVDA